MAFNLNSIELGKTLGLGMKQSSSYKEDFVESEELASLSLVNIGTINITGSYIISSVVYSSDFTVGHTVYGLIGSTHSPIGAATILGSIIIASGEL